ncbi:MAG: class F sortase [Ardenticatenales bacterium]
MNPLHCAARASLLAVLLVVPLGVGACGTAGIDVLPETDTRWARAELEPTYTPLPAPTETLTPPPTATATVPYQTATPDQFQSAGEPVRLRIPAVGIDAVIERAGRDSEGKVDVPKISRNVAWFNESALPGQSGKTSVISGHLDDPYGPAVFYKVRMLVPGDEVEVTYQNGKRFVFVVEAKERYAFDRAPVQKIFGATARRMLNLITCDGAWNSGQANYNQRLVVYSRLKEGQLAR